MNFVRIAMCAIADDSAIVLVKEVQRTITITKLLVVGWTRKKSSRSLPQTHQFVCKIMVINERVIYRYILNIQKIKLSYNHQRKSPCYWRVSLARN